MAVHRQRRDAERQVLSDRAADCSATSVQMAIGSPWNQNSSVSGRGRRQWHSAGRLSPVAMPALALQCLHERR